MNPNLLNDPPEKRKLKSFLIDAIQLARADGSFDDSEKDFIYDLAGDYSITKEEVDMILNSTEEFEYFPPSDFVERFEVLYHFIGVVLADRKIEKKEIRLCGALAIGLGYDSEIVNPLIEKIIDSIDHHMDPDKFYRDVEVKYRHPRTR